MKKTVSLATFVGTCLGNFPIPGQCYSFVKEGSTWEAMPPESSKYQRLRLKQSNAIWAVLKRKHKSGKGYQIGKYDTEKSIEENRWIAERKQPVGTGWGKVVVNSKGEPAFVGYTKERHIYLKQRDKWTEIEACSRNIAFGR